MRLIESFTTLCHMLHAKRNSHQICQPRCLTTPVKSPPRRTFNVPSLKKGGEFHHLWPNYGPPILIQPGFDYFKKPE